MRGCSCLRDQFEPMLGAMKALTDKQLAFAQHVTDIANPKSLTDAYRLAYKTDGMSDATIGKKASEEASKPAVAAKILDLRTKTEETFVFKQLDVLNEWMTVATADPGELIKPRRFCCRHCYGDEHRYQWRSEHEFAKACDAIIEANETRKAGRAPRDLPDPTGGFGYDRNRPPVATCPECEGDGVLDVFITAHDQLSPAARKLYAGIKQTRDGVQVLMRDQGEALANIAKYLGMFVEKREISGPGGGPIPSANVTLVAEVPLDEATRLYSAAMG